MGERGVGLESVEEVILCRSTPPSAVYIAVVLMSLPQVNHLSPSHHFWAPSILRFRLQFTPDGKLVFNRVLIVYPIGPPFLSRL